MDDHGSPGVWMVLGDPLPEAEQGGGVLGNPVVRPHQEVEQTYLTYRHRGAALTRYLGRGRRGRRGKEESEKEGERGEGRRGRRSRKGRGGRRRKDERGGGEEGDRKRRGEEEREKEMEIGEGRRRG